MVVKAEAQITRRKVSQLNSQLGFTTSVVSHPAVLEPFVEAESAASFLLMSPRTVKRLARECNLPAHPRGEGQRRRWLFLRRELDLWMRRRRNSTGKGISQ